MTFKMIINYTINLLFNYNTLIMILSVIASGTIFFICMEMDYKFKKIDLFGIGEILLFLIPAEVLSIFVAKSLLLSIAFPVFIFLYSEALV